MAELAEFYWTKKEDRILLQRARALDGVHIRHNLTPLIVEGCPAVSYHLDFINNAIKIGVHMLEVHYKGETFQVTIETLQKTGKQYIDTYGDDQIWLKLANWQNNGRVKDIRPKTTKKKSNDDDNPARLFDGHKNELLEVEA